MKIKEIRDKQTAAIELENKDLRKHLFELRTQAVTEKLEDPSLLRKTRKDIARHMTVLRERQLEVENKDKKPQKQRVRVRNLRKVKHAPTTKSQGKRVRNTKILAK